ncbi:myb/SANT-like domain-containing protein [Artemisia annua]|uniref:Myb/SANT-like domain-containing protein n=1 Tax=Artemisia annua TaxID=35608 RepID=A0A2U1QBA9_ARTAN|nr:myb/SANT-like domain-containing protein [Artemisia annua]
MELQHVSLFMKGKRMAPTNETSKANFNWTEQYVLNLCDFLIAYQNKKGQNCDFKWMQLQPEFEKKHNIKFNSKKSLKSKFDGMKRQFTLWKTLKNGETGLGWVESTGKLNCSNAWWDQKIEYLLCRKMKNFKPFRTKPPSKELQDARNQLFGDSVACGANEMAPGMDIGTSSQAPIANLEHIDVEFDDNADTYEVYTQFSNSLDAQEEAFYPDLMKDVGQDVPTSSQVGVSKQVNKSTKLTMKPKNVQMKRTGRDSTGSRMFKEFMVKQNEKQDRLIEILQSDASGVNKDDPYSASRCMSVLNGMIDGGMMEDDSPLYYLAMDLFKDAVTRELFLNMRSDDSRLKWLQHKQD